MLPTQDGQTCHFERSTERRSVVGLFRALVSTVRMPNIFYGGPKLRPQSTYSGFGYLFTSCCTQRHCVSSFLHPSVYSFILFLHCHLSVGDNSTIVNCKRNRYSRKFLQWTFVTPRLKYGVAFVFAAKANNSAKYRYNRQDSCRNGNGSFVKLLNRT